MTFWTFLGHPRCLQVLEKLTLTQIAGCHRAKPLCLLDLWGDNFQYFAMVAQGLQSPNHTRVYMNSNPKHHDHLFFLCSLTLHTGKEDMLCREGNWRARDTVPHHTIPEASSFSIANHQSSVILDGVICTHDSLPHAALPCVEPHWSAPATHLYTKFLS